MENGAILAQAPVALRPWRLALILHFNNNQSIKLYNVP